RPRRSPKRTRIYPSLCGPASVDPRRRKSVGNSLHRMEDLPGDSSRRSVFSSSAEITQPHRRVGDDTQGLLRRATGVCPESAHSACAQTMAAGSGNAAHSKTDGFVIKSAIHKSFRLFGLDIVRAPRDHRFPEDFGTEDADIIRQVRHWTMTSPERIY